MSLSTRLGRSALALCAALALTLPTSALAGSGLETVPADTPYAFASLKPLPEATMKAYFKSMGPMMDMVNKALDEAIQGPASSVEDKVIQALAKEFKGKLSVEGLTSMGFDLKGKMVFYGLGVLPVARISLSDSDKINTLIGRVVGASGVPPKTVKLGDLEYFSFGDNEGRVLIGVTANELVAAVVAAPMEKKLAPMIFGTEKVANNMEAAGTLSKAMAKHGLNPAGVGYVDVQRLVDTLTGSASGLHAEVINALDGPVEKPSPVCKKEFNSLVALSPRVIFGYESVSAQSITSRMIFETPQGLASELNGLQAPVPGLTAQLPEGAMGLFGFGLDLNKAVDFARKKAGNINANPYKCPDLQDLNEGAREMAQGLAQGIPPPVQAIMANFRGGAVRVDDVKMGPGGQPQSIKAVVTIASPDPLGLFNLAKLAGGAAWANLPLTDDAKVIDLPIPPQMAMMPFPLEEPSIAAMKGNGLGVSVGKGMKSGLPGTLKASAPKNPPVFVLGYDMGRFFATMAGATGGANPGMAEMQALLGGVGRVGYGVHFKPSGVEVVGHMYLK